MLCEPNEIRRESVYFFTSVTMKDCVQPVVFVRLMFTRVVLTPKASNVS